MKKLLQRPYFIMEVLLVIFIFASLTLQGIELKTTRDSLLAIEGTSYSIPSSPFSDNDVSTITTDLDSISSSVLNIQGTTMQGADLGIIHMDLQSIETNTER